MAANAPGIAVNALGQPIGPALPGWHPPAPPAAATIAGRYCRLERLQAERHAGDLFEANAADALGATWTYLNFGPFAGAAEHRQWVASVAVKSDPRFYAIVDAQSGRAAGVAAYLRITPDAGSIEVGSIHYSPRLSRTRAATEAMYLMMREAFALGYRRYEWKCDALNRPSRSAAIRLGFTFEGVFRQATVYKGRSRDTAWYAIVDRDWPALAAVHERWLDPDNFDVAGRQRSALGALTAQLQRSSTHG